MAVQHLLLPTDFSSGSKNAVEYAIQLVNSIHSVKKITLLHAYIANTAITNEPIINVTMPELLQEKQNDLNVLTEKVKAEIKGDITISSLLVEGKLITIAHDLIANEGIDLIVMGIAPKNKLEQSFIGSNAINVMRKTTCPVIVVPNRAKWIGNPNIAVAIDITHDASKIPFERIKLVVKTLDAAKLSLINVEDRDDHNAHIQNPNIDKINFEFGEVGSKLEIISNTNKLQAIEHYAMDKKVALIVLLERKYGILDTIFHKSLTRQLAFSSHTPILVLEELPED